MSDKNSSLWLQLEQSVIGGAMLDGSIVDKCDVSPADFMTHRHQEIWQCILRQAASGGDCDALTLAELLDQSGQLESSGGLPYLATLCRETASATAAPAYAKRVRELSVLRQAQVIGKALIDASDLEGIDTQIRSLMELTKGTRNHTCDIFEAMQMGIELLDDTTAQLSTGLKDLDDCTGGLHNEDLIIVAARPAMGKTAFMLNLALAATDAVGIISGEQGRGQIGLRTMAIEGNVSLHRMRTQSMDDMDWKRVTDAMNAAKTKKIWINDKPAPTIDEVIRQARMWKHERDIGVLMIDYLQKLRGGGGSDLRLQIGDVVSRLKDLARELKIPVVVLAQVKRDVETRAVGTDGMGRMPFMSDIAESAIVENEADHIYTLYRPQVYSDQPQFNGLAYVNICKNRHGPIGHKAIAWRGEYLQFGDLAAQEISYRDRWEHTA